MNKKSIARKKFDSVQKSLNKLVVIINEYDYYKDMCNNLLHKHKKGK